MATKQQPAKKLPDYVAYAVSEHAPDDKGFWTQIGAAWAHEDNEGFNIQLSALPFDGKLVMRLRKDKPKQAK